MGRRLPWKTPGSGTPVKAGISSPTTPSRTPIAISAPASRSKRAPDSTPLRPRKRSRSPSTSPPPEPPKEEFMIPSDDRYRIVEDEFLHTARLFTAHIHRAEYNRQKTLARSHNAAAIRAIHERPVVGSPTRIAKQRREASLREARQRSFSLAAGGDDAKADEDVLNQSGLRGLMDSPRKEARTIRSYKSTVAETRAAAGFGSRAGSPSRRTGRIPDSARQVSSGRDAPDHTKAISRPRADSSSTTVATKSARSSTFPMHQIPKAISRVRSEPNLKRPPSSTSQKVRHEDKEEDDDDDDLFGMKKRRIRRVQSREQMQRSAQQRSAEKQSKQTAPDVIPSFL